MNKNTNFMAFKLFSEHDKKLKYPNVSWSQTNGQLVISQSEASDSLVELESDQADFEIGHEIEHSASQSVNSSETF